MRWLCVLMEVLWQALVALRVWVVICVFVWALPWLLFQALVLAKGA